MKIYIGLPHSKKKLTKKVPTGSTIVLKTVHLMIIVPPFVPPTGCI